MVYRSWNPFRFCNQHTARIATRNKISNLAHISTDSCVKKAAQKSLLSNSISGKVLSKTVTAFLGLSLLSGCVEDSSNAMVSADQGNNRTIKIVNQYVEEMREIQVSSSSSQYWGFNRIGQPPLATGSTRAIIFGDGSSDCLYDFKARFSDGNVVVANDVNVCEKSNVTF